MIKLLWRLLEFLDERVERWLSDKQDWRSTALLSVVSQTVTASIVLFPVLVIGAMVYACRYEDIDVRWLWGTVLVLVLVPLVVVLRRWQLNILDDRDERVAGDKTRFCPSCGRECSVSTVVCPRCEASLRRRG